MKPIDNTANELDLGIEDFSASKMCLGETLNELNTEIKK